MTRQVVGSFEGNPIEEITLTAPGGAQAKVLTYGAILRDLKVPLADGSLRRVVVGFADVGAYLHNPGFVGTTVGRYANRIGKGRFHIDGHEYTVSRNEGENHLHGGVQGFSHKLWRLVSAEPDSVTLALTSPDGDQGFPGTLEATCVYRLLDPGTLRVELTATTDAPTLCNLCNHAYFTLEPGRAIRDLTLQVAAQHYTPVDAGLIPTGEIAPVAGTPYDFRLARPIGDEARYDLNFVIDRSERGLKHAATLRSPRDGLVLEVWTTEPGLQLYDGGGLGAEPAGLDGAIYFPHAGVCLETQLFPDSPNQPGFPSPLLQPGDVYEHITDYRFVAG
ncbi:aldose epimerase family protein [Segnochrobactrum spirostomi]|uniref:Aldose 1-epimerase n=1 Tax=Segnochrobactrum spirostomi TaxID=2608987 RepID=A0A6A7XXN9_9HYPH|nr:aldose epimerase family protein [Segnochrobactrum spirostomi]MQT11175.1 galactose mutarotase [Segnochrobactrum spirostomi]